MQSLFLKKVENITVTLDFTVFVYGFPVEFHIFSMVFSHYCLVFKFIIFITSYNKLNMKKKINKQLSVM